MKKIGILGGISAASTIDYYKKILDLYYEKYQDYYYPEITIESLDFQYFTDFEDNNEMEGYKRYIMKSIKNLENTGSELIIMSANSPHSVYPYVKSQTNTPMISIVEAVGRQAQKQNLKKLLLTGIKYTMQSTFYQEGLKQFGIEVIAPNDEDKDIINDIIFSELVLGIISVQAQEKFLAIINKYIDSDQVEGVILGCTELPSLAKEMNIPIAALNSLEIHCKEILEFIEK